MGSVKTVVIEWNSGNDQTVKPPTRWYSWLAKKAPSFRMRGNGDRNTTYEWRSRGDDIGLVVQEGCIITTSESLARQLAFEAVNVATEFGYKTNVMLIIDGEVVPLKMTQADMDVMQRVNSVLGRRGRPVGDKSKWLITCAERMESYVVEEYDVISTPKGSMNYTITKGVESIPVTGIPQNADEWVRCRFMHGTFHVGGFEDGGKIHPTPTIRNKAEKSELDIVLAAIQKGDIPEPVGMVDVRYADAVYVARAYHSKESCNRERIKAIAKYFAIGGSPIGVLMFRRDNEADIFDAAIVLGDDETARLARKLYSSKGEGK